MPEFDFMGLDPCIRVEMLGVMKKMQKEKIYKFCSFLDMMGEGFLDIIYDGEGFLDIIYDGGRVFGHCL